MALEITIDEFRKQVRDNRPKCLICGHQAHSLVAHVREVHDLSPGQYRKKFPDSEMASAIALELLRFLGKNPTRDSVSLSDIFPRFVPNAKGAATCTLLDDWKAKLGWFQPDTSDLQYMQDENKLFRFTSNAQPMALGFATGRNVFVSGPSGCGKTEEIKQVTRYLGVPLRRANMHGDVTYNTFIGSMKANAQGTYFEYGLLPKAMMGGYPVLLDEIDFTPPSIASVMHPVLERDGELYIPETGEHIKPKKGFMVFATGNTGGKGDMGGAFSGTEVLNTAFLDRFSVKLTANYLPEDEEILLLKATNQSLTDDFLKKTVKFANEVRSAFKAGDLVLTWSTRKVLDFVEFVDIMSVQEALDLTLYNWLDKEDRPFVDKLMKTVGLAGAKVK